MHFRFEYQNIQSGTRVSNSPNRVGFMHLLMCKAASWHDVLERIRKINFWSWMKMRKCCFSVGVYDISLSFKIDCHYILNNITIICLLHRVEETMETRNGSMTSKSGKSVKKGQGSPSHLAHTRDDVHVCIMCCRAIMNFQVKIDFSEMCHLWRMVERK